MCLCNLAVPLQTSLSLQHSLALLIRKFKLLLVYAQEVIGDVTGSRDWQQSGQQNKQTAVEDMRSATSDRKEAQQERAEQGGSWVKNEGAVESAFGKLTNCKGMVEEGENKKQGGQ